MENQENYKIAAALLHAQYVSDMGEDQAFNIKIHMSNSSFHDAAVTVVTRLLNDIDGLREVVKNDG